MVQKLVPLAVLAVFGFIPGCSSDAVWLGDPVAAENDDLRSGGPVYSIAEYDPQRNAAQDLAATVVQAQKEGKRILLEVGGDW